MSSDCKQRTSSHHTTAAARSSFWSATFKLPLPFAPVAADDSSTIHELSLWFVNHRNTWSAPLSIKVVCKSADQVKKTCAETRSICSSGGLVDSVFCFGAFQDDNFAIVGLINWVEPTDSKRGFFELAYSPAENPDAPPSEGDKCTWYQICVPNLAFVQFRQLHQLPPDAPILVLLFYAADRNDPPLNLHLHMPNRDYSHDLPLPLHRHCMAVTRIFTTRPIAESSTPGVVVVEVVRRAVLTMEAMWDQATQEQQAALAFGSDQIDDMIALVAGLEKDETKALEALHKNVYLCRLVRFAAEVSLMHHVTKEDSRHLVEELCQEMKTRVPDKQCIPVPVEVPSQAYLERKTWFLSDQLNGEFGPSSVCPFTLTDVKHSCAEAFKSEAPLPRYQALCLNFLGGLSSSRPVLRGSPRPEDCCSFRFPAPPQEKKIKDNDRVLQLQYENNTLVLKAKIGIMSGDVKQATRRQHTIACDTLSRNRQDGLLLFCPEARGAGWYGGVEDGNLDSVDLVGGSELQDMRVACSLWIHGQWRRPDFALGKQQVPVLRLDSEHTVDMSKCATETGNGSCYFADSRSELAGTLQLFLDCCNGPKRCYREASVESLGVEYFQSLKQLGFIWDSNPQNDANACTLFCSALRALEGANLARRDVTSLTMDEFTKCMTQSVWASLVAEEDCHILFKFATCTCQGRLPEMPLENYLLLFNWLGDFRLETCEAVPARVAIALLSRINDDNPSIKFVGFINRHQLLTQQRPCLWFARGHVSNNKAMFYRGLVLSSHGDDDIVQRWLFDWDVKLCKVFQYSRRNVPDMLEQVYCSMTKFNQDYDVGVPFKTLQDRRQALPHGLVPLDAHWALSADVKAVSAATPADAKSESKSTTSLLVTLPESLKDASLVASLQGMDFAANLKAATADAATTAPTSTSFKDCQVFETAKERKACLLQLCQIAFPKLQLSEAMSQPVPDDIKTYMFPYWTCCTRTSLQAIVMHWLSVEQVQVLRCWLHDQLLLKQDSAVVTTTAAVENSTVLANVKSLDDLVTVVENIGEGQFSIVSKVAAKSNPQGDLYALKRFRAEVQNVDKKTLQALDGRESQLYRHLAGKINDERRRFLLLPIKEIHDPNSGLDARILPLCDGTLNELIHFRLRNVKFFKDLEILVLMQHMMSAVHLLHETGFLHRDIHTGNVLFLSGGDASCRRSRFVLSDFGLLCSFSKEDVLAAPVASTLEDTCALRAPELDREVAKYAATTDVWDLGLLFATTMTRMQLGPEFARLRRKQRIGPSKAEWLYSELKAYAAHFPHTLPLVLNMLQEDPEQRPTLIHLLSAVQGKVQKLIDRASIDAWCSAMTMDIVTDMAFVKKHRDRN